MSNPKNRECPECAINGHDSKKDHLFLMDNGEMWCCVKKEYHANQMNYYENVGQENSLENIKKQAAQRFSNPQALSPNVSTTLTEDAMEDYRNIPAQFYKDWGIWGLYDSSGNLHSSRWELFEEGKPVGTKTRELPKDFYTTGKLKGRQIQFFGQDRCRGAKKLLIVEGEYDAIASDIMFSGTKYKAPDIVSLPFGAEKKALNIISQQKKFLDKYKELVFCMDSDDAGNETTTLIYGMRQDILVMDISEKDPMDMLKEGKEQEFINAFYTAEPWKPSCMVSVNDIIDEAVAPVEWGLSYPWQRLTDMTYGSRGGLVCVVGAPGSGKALRHGETVVTEEGHRTVEDLVVGDIIYGTNGTTKVTGVYPQGEKDIYRVTFTDTTSLEVSGDHLWTMNHTKGRVCTLDTLELKKRHREGAEKKRIFSLPQYKGVEWVQKDLPVDPYVLGVWLGDGNNSDSRISCPKDKVESSHFDYYDPKNQRYFKYGLTVKLRDLGVLGDKHIPEVYLEANEYQRSRLLQGLLDTDGCNEGRKGICFDNTEERLVEGVVYLARSLGYTAKVRAPKMQPYYTDVKGTKVYCKPCYRAHIKHPYARTNKRYVDSVKYIGKDLCTCISVDSEDSLFLAGDFIPTHNTTVLKQLKYNFIENHSLPIGDFDLENPPLMTLKQLIGGKMQKPIHLPDCVYDEAEARKIAQKFAPMVHLYDHKGWRQWDDILNYMRYLHTFGVNRFFIDPLSALTVHLSASDANTYINKAMMDMSMFIQEFTDVQIFHSNHANNGTGKDAGAGGRIYGGQISGSRAQWRFSTDVWVIERDQTADDPAVRSEVTLRSIKDRLAGKTDSIQLHYNKNTGLLDEPTIKFGGN